MNKKRGIGALFATKQFEEHTVYEAFEGKFFDDGYDLGVYYEESPLDKSFCAYYGLYDDFKKNDKEGLFYVFYDDETSVIIGELEKDLFKEGVKFNFDENGAFLNFILFSMNEQQTEHEHKDQGESEEKMSEEIKEKFKKVKIFFEIVKSELRNFKENYKSLVNRNIRIDNFEEYYKQYEELQNEICSDRQSNFSKALFDNIKKEAKSDRIL